MCLTTFNRWLVMLIIICGSQRTRTPTGICSICSSIVSPVRSFVAPAQIVLRTYSATDGGSGAGFTYLRIPLGASDFSASGRASYRSHVLSLVTYCLQYIASTMLAGILPFPASTSTTPHPTCLAPFKTSLASTAILRSRSRPGHL